MMEEADCQQPLLSPEKRRRKIPDKFRDHVVQELASHGSSNSDDSISGWAEPAPTEPEVSVVNSETENETVTNEAVFEAVAPVKRSRGRPRKLPMGSAHLPAAADSIKVSLGLNF